MSKGKLIVISGASGVGKGTVLGIMMKKRDDLQFSVSATTRDPRPGEVHGVHYYFITKDRFREKIAYVHLKDFVRKGMGWSPAACGEGNMDWPGLLAEMRSFKGPALLEYEIPDDAERGFADSLKFLINEEKDLAS